MKVGKPGLRKKSVRDAIERGAPSGRRTTVAHLLLRFRPRPGDILLFRHPERFRSTLISWFTRSPYYHVAIYAGNGEVIEARLPQVVRRNVYNEKDGFRFVVIHAPSPAIGAAALAWARTRVGARYDLQNLILWVFGRLLHIPRLCQFSSLDRYVCGNFVVRAYEAAGVDLFPDQLPAEICPADFAKLRTPESNEMALRPRHTIARHSYPAIPLRSVARTQ